MKHNKQYIHLKGIEFVGPHGVYLDERTRGCRFRLDIELEIAALAGFHSDKLEDTLNYEGLSARIIEVATQESYWLLERLAERLAEVCFEYAESLSVKIDLLKLAPSIGGSPAAVGVTIVRYRPDAA